MPNYEFRCQSGHSFTKFFDHNYEPGWTLNPALRQFETGQICTCGAVARRAISAPLFSVDNTGYDCPVTGKWIGSKHQHEENLKHQGCRVLEVGETSATIERRAKEEAAFDKAIEDTVEKEITSWDSDKRERLHNELVQGADIVVERR